ncbi:hypothetical protein GCM10008940_34810 [Microbulbifer agarilyticus]
MGREPEFEDFYSGSVDFVRCNVRVSFYDDFFVCKHAGGGILVKNHESVTCYRYLTRGNSSGGGYIVPFEALQVKFHYRNIWHAYELNVHNDNRITNMLKERDFRVLIGAPEGYREVKL